MQQYRDEAHVGQVAVVAHQLPARALHQVTPIEAELGLGITLAQGLHQVAGMKVAAGLPHNQIIPHDSSTLRPGNTG